MSTMSLGLSLLRISDTAEDMALSTLISISSESVLASADIPWISCRVLPKSAVLPPDAISSRSRAYAPISWHSSPMSLPRSEHSLVISRIALISFVTIALKSRSMISDGAAPKISRTSASSTLPSP